jgi:hypothetical protein
MENFLRTWVALWIGYLILFIILIFTVGFPQETNVQSCLTGSPKGFWYGLWEGWVIFISFIVSLFDNDVTIYSVNNNGVWYNFGYMLGAGHLLRYSTHKKK